MVLGLKKYNLPDTKINCYFWSIFQMSYANYDYEIVILGIGNTVNVVNWIKYISAIVLKIVCNYLQTLNKHYC